MALTVASPTSTLSNTTPDGVRLTMDPKNSIFVSIYDRATGARSINIINCPSPTGTINKTYINNKGVVRL